MRVAHIITRMIIGGAQENTLFNCLDLIRDHGDECLLVTGPSLGPEGDLLQRGGVEDLPVHVADSLRRAINPGRDWKAYRQLSEILSRYRPDVVHTHSAKGGILGREVAWRLGVPAVVHTVHGAPFHPYQPLLVRRFYRACERRAASRCHRMISVADAMTDLMVDAGVAPRDRFVTIHSGMDVAPLLEADRHRAAMRRKYGFADDDVVVIKIARLFHLKGHRDLIQAAGNRDHRMQRIKFLLVGDGVLQPSLRREIDARGLADQFVFAGLVDPAEIPAHLAAADLLVHCSYREGLARALPQALVAGKPVVSYDVDGAREVVIDGVTGRLLAAGDIPGLRLAIETLAADPVLRRRQGEEGRRRFTDQFRHQTMTQRIRQLYLQLLRQAGQGGG
jgi:glycosyltransferase involved in cell wall biosynthesis